MKPSLNRLTCAVLLAALTLTACRSTQALPTLVPTFTPRPPTDTPAPLPTATATGVFAPLPTATPLLSATPEPGAYTNPALGVRLRYPDGWRLQPDERTDVLTWVISPQDEVFALLFVSARPADESLQTTALAMWEGVSDGMTDLTLLKNEPLILGDGRMGWTTLGIGLQDQTRLKLSLTTTSFGRYLFSLLTFAEASAYDGRAAEINPLLASLQAGPPEVHGLPRDQTLVLAGGESTNPRDYDPATTQSGPDNLLYSGLVAFDANLNVVPDLAASWDVVDGTRYVFHLRPTARFHNGRPITARDVVYSWERAAAPDTASDTVLTYLGDIVGVPDRRAGRADRITGLSILDDYTLAVTIDAPKPYFLLKLTSAPALIVDRANVDAGPDWYRAPNGSGPYRLARWDSFQVMILERNPLYYGPAPAIPYVVFELYAGYGLRLYETGAIDLTSVSAFDLPRLTDPDEPMHAELRQGPTLCTDFLVFDVTQPPFDDARVRQAFTLAFDRQTYVDVVLNGIGVPARGLFPPGLPGYTPGLRGLDYDPERARQLLAESTYGGAAGLPPITLTTAGLGSDLGGLVTALAEMWQRELGVTLTVENLEPDRYADEITAGRHGQLFEWGCCADYPDPENFADVLLHSGAEQNFGHYANAAVDAWLEQARVEPDVAQRLALYQQAEQQIVDDAPLLFLTHGQSFVLVKPYIQGYRLSPFNVSLVPFLSLDGGRLANP